MGKNLASRTGFIVAVLLIFTYGIFGIPHGGLKQSLENRINLGLDLKGGTHLVLQVHVAEAVNSSTDHDVQALNTALAATGATAAKLDPAHPETITVSGGSPTQQSAMATRNSNAKAERDNGGTVLRAAREVKRA